ncbi:MAG: glycosyltransferase family 39 protein [Fimbriimonadaceae bacterium]|nr:glycosyltransferase family 39 protein [Fimbriimonadaceae bacterium]
MSFVVALLVVVVTGLAGLPLSRRWGWSVEERLGAGVLVGCGALGTATLLVGLLPGGLKLAVWVVPALFAWPAWKGYGELRSLEFGRPKPDQAGRFLLVGIVLLALFSLVGALSFPDSLEWDSLAYHLAVPKLWLHAGQIGYVQGIHHSNFPFVVECAEMWGLAAAGYAGAKLVSWSLMVAGALTVYGMAKRWSGPAAGHWAALAVMASPVVAWEGGTAYIDHVHGLFAGLGVLYLGEWVKRRPDASVWPAGILLGLACASKLTGLQTLAVAGVAALVFVLRSRDRKVGPLLVAGALAFAIASPWLVKSFVYTGNPVYPFFYEKLGGKDWDGWRASIYRDEQQSFGVERTATGRSPALVGHAVLGLAYQPGRYTNPRQTEGGGSPTGAVGALAIVTLFLLAVRGPRDTVAKFTLTTVGLSLAAWFVLSQQSRYLATLAVVAAPFVPVVYGRGGWQWLGRVLVAGQAAATLFVLYTLQTKDQMQVLFGVVPPAAYQRARVGFTDPAQYLNADPEVTKVALYDEVFGFLLDKPYFWANPGHSKLIPYETISDGTGLADALRRLGFSHVYWNTMYLAPDAWDRFLAASGMQPGEPYSDKEREEMSRDLNLKWHMLVAEAVRSGRLVPEKAFGRRLIFKLN